MTEKDKQEILAAINDVKRVDRAKITLKFAIDEYIEAMKICQDLELKPAITYFHDGSVEIRIDI